MSKREMLKKRIEEERRKLDEMLAQEKSSDEIYEQSVTLDRLIEEYRASRSAAFHPKAVCGHFGNPALASR